MFNERHPNLTVRMPHKKKNVYLQNNGILSKNRPAQATVQYLRLSLTLFVRGSSSCQANQSPRLPVLRVGGGVCSNQKPAGFTAGWKNTILEKKKQNIINLCCFYRSPYFQRPIILSVCHNHFRNAVVVVYGPARCGVVAISSFLLFAP